MALVRWRAKSSAVLYYLWPQRIRQRSISRGGKTAGCPGRAQTEDGGGGRPGKSLGGRGACPFGARSRRRKSRAHDRRQLPFLFQPRAGVLQTGGALWHHLVRRTGVSKRRNPP